MIGPDTKLHESQVMNFSNTLFEKFSKTSASNVTCGMKIPFYIYSRMLLKSKVAIAPLPFIDMYHWIMKAKNGGLSIVTTRYERATNLPSEIARGYFEETYQTQEFYNPNGETIRLYYIDANQLYPECINSKVTC